MATADVAASRRRLIVDGSGIAFSGLAFGAVYGIAARNAGFSAVEASAMSAFAFGGAAQFAAVGYVAQGMPWLLIVALTAVTNARHLLYGAVLLPWVRDQPRRVRAAMAYFLTDETFALTLAHFRRLGRADLIGYWIVGIGLEFASWNLGTVAGALLGGAIPDPTALALDIVFSAAMAALAVGLIDGRKELVAAATGAISAVVVSLVAGTAVGVIVGGLAGPVIALALFGRGPAAADASAEAERPR